MSSLSRRSRVIVVGDCDAQFRAINDMAGVDAFAFSAAALAIAAARSLEPDAFVVAHRAGGFDGYGLVAGIRSDAELCRAKTLLLTDGPEHDADETIADAVVPLWTDLRRLRGHLGILLRLAEPRAVAVPREETFADSRRSERHSDSLLRLARLEDVGEAVFLVGLLREASYVLREDVAFSGALLRLDGGGWAVDAVYRPDGADVALPEAGTRIPFQDTAVYELMRSGSTFMTPTGDDAGRIHCGDTPWRSLIAVPVKLGASLYVIALAAASSPRRCFDALDRSYVEALGSICAARLSRRPGSLRDIVPDDFVLDLRPQFHLRSGLLAGGDAVIRWNHGGRGTAAPLRVLRKAAAAALRLCDIDPLFRIWFQVSASELSDARAIRRIAQSGDALRGLGVEIAHGALNVDLGGRLRALATLKDAGLPIALGGFGAGTFSPARLTDVPLDVVKVDRSLTAGVPRDARDRDIFEAIFELGRRFRFDTVADAVETAEQAAWLRAAGCSFGQGPHFGVPMTVDQLAAALLARSPFGAGAAARSRAIAV